MGFKDKKNSQIIDEIIETVKEVFPDAKVVEIEKPEEPEVVQETKPIDIPANEEKPQRYKAERPGTRKKKKVVKKRESKKTPMFVGVTGNTVEAKEFRAIIKKKGLQINTVLNSVLSQWNQANYNL